MANNGQFRNNKWVREHYLLIGLSVIILLSSCGIRPLKIPDRNIVGVEATTSPLTQPEETNLPVYVTQAEETAPIQFYDAPRSIIGDPEYVESHTIGIYYIQNKQNGKVFTPQYMVRWFFFDTPYDGVDNAFFRHYPHVTELMDLMEWDCQKFRLIELEKGMYALLSYETYTDNIWKREEHTAYEGTMMYPPLAKSYDRQALIIKKTSSGAFSITTKYDDVGSPFVVALQPDSIEKSISNITWRRLYKDDTDYSDEWLFIPVDGSPEFNP